MAHFLRHLAFRRGRPGLDTAATKPCPARPAQYPPRPIEVGMRLGEFSGVSLTGAVSLVPPPKEPGEKLLLITMSPGCPICRANLADWTGLTLDLKRRSGWRVVWVSRDPLNYARQYCERNNIALPEILAEPSYSTYLRLRLEGVPYTVIVGPGGVEKVWRGRLTPQAILEIRRLSLT